MKLTHLDFQADFQIALHYKRAQAAEMVLQPGENTGGPDNRHRGADQWLFVVSGSGEAVVNGQQSKLATGDLLLIERGESHEIRCTGESPLQTLNFYCPPAYTAQGETLPAGES